MFGPCFDMQCYVSFLAVKSSSSGREGCFTLSVVFPRVPYLLLAVGWSELYGCDISWSYSLTC